ncbi:Uncharacterized protein Adt_07742 [Abeliophyllum distichum]|uniref:DUF4283 domain-containing protein n=1 Tax=Abeliophyllum distichum TaxID=126358 RepID=A0ABD1VAL7_9LAMI
MRSKGVIFSLAKIVGIPLHIDEATADLLRPSQARVCMEVNLEHKLPEWIWIDRDDGRSFWQTVVYEKPPLFCSKCRHMGHSLGQCRAGGPPFTHFPTVVLSGQPPHSTSLPLLPTQTISASPITSTVTEITDKARKAKGKEIVVDQLQQWAPVRSRARRRRGAGISTSTGPTTLAGPSRGSRFGVLAESSLDTVQFSTVVSSMAHVATIS